jgi:hypothetical protein
MISTNERLRSPSRRQKTMIQIRGRPATWVDRFVRRRSEEVRRVIEAEQYAERRPLGFRKTQGQILVSCQPLAC